MRIHRAMFLLPLLFVLGCAVDDAQQSTPQTDDSLSFSLVSDSPSADPASPPRVVRSPALSGLATVVGHTCNVLGGDGSTEGVHCADLAFVQNATGWDIWAVGQALCQPSGGGTEKQCAGIRQNTVLFDLLGPLASSQHNCGRFGGSACPATVRFQNASGHFQLAVPAAGKCVEIWAAMINDEIVLPVSAKTVGPGPNVASTHVQFCN